MGYSGARGTLIYEKKSRVRLSRKYRAAYFFNFNIAGLKSQEKKPRRSVPDVVKGDFLQMSVSDHILPGCLKKRRIRELSLVSKGLLQIQINVADSDHRRRSTMKRPTVFCCRNFSSPHLSLPPSPLHLSYHGQFGSLVASHHMFSLPLSSLCVAGAAKFCWK
jgi:hypothetical protein